MSTVNTPQGTRSQVTVKLADLPPKVSPQTRQYVMTDEERHEIQHALTHYAVPRAATIDALKIVQRHHGWVPDGALTPIAELVGTSAADVEGVATFYNLIYRQPVGRHVIKICNSLSCFLTGLDEVTAGFKATLGIAFGQTTPDDRFTLLPIVCLGACDKAPVLMIDDDTHFDVDATQIPAILERYP
jgi:NADH-quinone oxidoreductase subunit E